MSPDAGPYAAEIAEIAFLAAMEADEALAGHACLTESLDLLDRAVSETGDGPLSRAMAVIGQGYCGFRADADAQRRVIRAVRQGSRTAGDLRAVRDLCHAMYDVLTIGPDSIRPELISGSGRRSRSRSPARPTRRHRSSRTSRAPYRLPW